VWGLVGLGSRRFSGRPTSFEEVEHVFSREWAMPAQQISPFGGEALAVVPWRRVGGFAEGGRLIFFFGVGLWDRRPQWAGLSAESMRIDAVFANAVFC